jgi:hypothetical protein
MDKKAATIVALGLVLCGLLIGGGIAAGQYLGRPKAQVTIVEKASPEAVQKAFDELAKSY